MTTDAERAAVLSAATARELNQARESLVAALGRVSGIETALEDCAQDALLLSRESVDVATAGEQIRPQVSRTREYAGSLSAKLESVQDTLAGNPSQDRVSAGSSPGDELTSAANAVGRADEALAELQGIEGHDASGARVLQERAGLLRGAIDSSRSALRTVDDKLGNARVSLDVLMGDRLNPNRDPGRLAGTVASVGTTATQDIGNARLALAQTQGRLDTATQAARVGLNPTPVGDQRSVVPSSERARRSDSGARGRPEHGK